MTNNIKMILLALISYFNITKATSDGTSDIAICMSGHVRSLIQKNVYTSLKQNLLDSIKSQQNQNVDIFLYLDLDENQKTQQEVKYINAGWDIGPKDMKTLPSQLETVLKIIKPIKLEFHNETLISSKYKTSKFNDLISFNKNNYTCQYPSKQAGPQLLKMNICYHELIVKHERLIRGFQYKWIIRSRPDLGWFAPMPSIDLFNNKYIYATSKYWPMGDQVRKKKKKLI